MHVGYIREMGTYPMSIQLGGRQFFKRERLSFALTWVNKQRGLVDVGRTRAFSSVPI
jgi:hypothetical protein